MDNETLIYRLRERARIRRQIPTRKSVQNNEPDRIADLLEEAAARIESLEMGEGIAILEIHNIKEEIKLLKNNYDTYNIKNILPIKKPDANNS